MENGTQVNDTEKVGVMAAIRAFIGSVFEDYKAPEETVDKLKGTDETIYKELINSEKRREEMIKKLEPVIQKRKAMEEYGVETENSKKTSAPKIQSAKVQNGKEEDREI